MACFEKQIYEYYWPAQADTFLLGLLDNNSSSVCVMPLDVTVAKRKKDCKYLTKTSDRSSHISSSNNNVEDGEIK